MGITFIGLYLRQRGRVMGPKLGQRVVHGTTHGNRYQVYIHVFRYKRGRVSIWVCFTVYLFVIVFSCRDGLTTIYPRFIIHCFGTIFREGRATIIGSGRTFRLYWMFFLNFHRAISGRFPYRLWLQWSNYSPWRRVQSWNVLFQMKQ